MNDRHDLESAVAARVRGRARVRAATTVAGVAGLVTAGVVAYNLPGPAHQQAKTANSASTGGAAASPGLSGSSGSSRSAGDDGGEGSASSQTTAPASGGPPGTSHATSGGS